MFSGLNDLSIFITNNSPKIWVLHCEFVYSTPSTVFMLPFINLAAVPEFGCRIENSRIESN